MNRFLNFLLEFGLEKFVNNPQYIPMIINESSEKAAPFDRKFVRECVHKITELKTKIEQYN